MTRTSHHAMPCPPPTKHFSYSSLKDEVQTVWPEGAIFMQLWQCFNRIWQYFLVFGKILSMILVYFSCYSVGANIIAGKWPPNIEWEMYSASHLVTLRVRTKKQNKYPNICPSSHQLFNCRKLRAIFPEQSSLRKEGPTTEGLPTRTICIETFLIGPIPGLL